MLSDEMSMNRALGGSAGNSLQGRPSEGRSCDIGCGLGVAGSCSAFEDPGLDAADVDLLDIPSRSSAPSPSIRGLNRATLNVYSRAFTLLDSDSNGTVCPNEILFVAKGLGVSMSAKEVDMLFAFAEPWCDDGQLSREAQP